MLWELQGKPIPHFPEYTHPKERHRMVMVEMAYQKACRNRQKGVGVYGAAICSIDF